METEKITTDNFVEENKTSKSNISQDLFQQPANKSSKPTIAGILLIIAGILAFVLWIMAITIDVSTIESMMDISQFQELDPTITPERIRESLIICATIE